MFWVMNFGIGVWGSKPSRRTRERLSPNFQGIWFGFRVQGSGFRVRGLRGFGFRGFRVQGSGGQGLPDLFRGPRASGSDFGYKDEVL